MFVNQALLDEEQRRGRGRTSDSGSEDTTLKSSRRFGNKNEKPTPVLIVVNLLQIVLNAN